MELRKPPLPQHTVPVCKGLMVLTSIQLNCYVQCKAVMQLPNVAL